MSRAETTTRTRVEAAEVERAICPECEQAYPPEALVRWRARSPGGDDLLVERCPSCSAGLFDLDEAPVGAEYVGPSRPESDSESGRGESPESHPAVFVIILGIIAAFVTAAAVTIIHMAGGAAAVLADVIVVGATNAAVGVAVLFSVLGLFPMLYDWVRSHE